MTTLTTPPQWHSNMAHRRIADRRAGSPDADCAHARDGAGELHTHQRQDGRQCLPIGRGGKSTGKTLRHTTGTRRNLGHPEHESIASVLAPNSHIKTVEHKFPRCHSNL